MISFNPASFSDVPLYNIQAVAAATGIPSITLRSWERRYGVPDPKRDPKGYRLYSERDIAVTRWLKERVHQGVGISRAVNMLRSLEHGQLAPVSLPALSFEALKVRLLDSIRHLDETAINQVIGEGLMVAPVEELALQVLQPALYEIGEQWADGDLTATTEHVGSNLVRAHLAQFIRMSPNPYRHDTVVVGCAPEELHDIGSLMLALFLRRRGFRVVYVGANVEPDSFIADVARLQPAAVALSASTPHAARRLADLFARLRTEYDGVLACGGRAFNQSPELADTVPAIYLGEDALRGADNLERAMAGATGDPAAHGKGRDVARKTAHDDAV